MGLILVHKVAIWLVLSHIAQGPDRLLRACSLFDELPLPCGRSVPRLYCLLNILHMTLFTKSCREDQMMHCKKGTWHHRWHIAGVRESELWPLLSIWKQDNTIIILGTCVGAEWGRLCPAQGWVPRPAAAVKVSKSTEFGAGQAWVQAYFIPGSHRVFPDI